MEEYTQKPEKGKICFPDTKNFPKNRFSIYCFSYLHLFPHIFMSSLYLLTTLAVFASAAFAVFWIRFVSLTKTMERREQKIIALYKEKIDKIPAFIEIMAKHTAYKDIFLEIIQLHKVAIISNV